MKNESIWCFIMTPVYIKNADSFSFYKKVVATTNRTTQNLYTTPLTRSKIVSVASRLWRPTGAPVGLYRHSRAEPERSHSPGPRRRSLGCKKKI